MTSSISTTNTNPERKVEKEDVVKRFLARNAKKRAKKLGVDFTISYKDIELNTVCPIFKVPMYRRYKGLNDYSYSLDRLDNSKGYVPGNVRVISWRANYLKSNLKVEEVERLLAYMKGEL